MYMYLHMSNVWFIPPPFIENHINTHFYSTHSGSPATRMLRRRSCKYSSSPSHAPTVQHDSKPVQTRSSTRPAQPPTSPPCSSPSSPQHVLLPSSASSPLPSSSSLPADHTSIRPPRRTGVRPNHRKTPGTGLPTTLRRRSWSTAGVQHHARVLHTGSGHRQTPPTGRAVVTAALRHWPCVVHATRTARPVGMYLVRKVGCCGGFGVVVVVAFLAVLAGGQGRRAWRTARWTAVAWCHRQVMGPVLMRRSRGRRRLRRSRMHCRSACDHRRVILVCGFCCRRMWRTCRDRDRLWRTGRRCRRGGNSWLGVFVAM